MPKNVCLAPCLGKIQKNMYRPPLPMQLFLLKLTFPSYRKPQIWNNVVRSVLVLSDRCCVAISGTVAISGHNTGRYTEICAPCSHGKNSFDER